MDVIEKVQLESIFDALDRLFDREISVEELYSLMSTSDRTLSACPSSSLLSEYMEGLETILDTGLPKEAERERALEITQALRDTLNEMLPI